MPYGRGFSRKEKENEFQQAAKGSTPIANADLSRPNDLEHGFQTRQSHQRYPGALHLTVHLSPRPSDGRQVHHPRRRRRTTAAVTLITSRRLSSSLIVIKSLSEERPVTLYDMQRRSRSFSIDKQLV